MYWGYIHRMILWELLKIFGLSLVALTSLILMAGIIAEAIRNGLGPMQILSAIPFLLPSLLPYTVPTTTLFATCIVYGRLSADSEILALKAAGIHIAHVIWPSIFLGLVTTLITAALYFDVIPSTHFFLRTEMVRDVEELLYTMLRKDGFIRHSKMPCEIHVSRVQGQKLQDVLFMRKAKDGNGFDLIARAQEAELRFEPASKRLNIQMFRCQLVEGGGGGGIVDIESNTWPIELPPEFNNPVATKQRPTDMTWLELFEFQARFETEKQRLSEEIARHQAPANFGRALPGFDEHVRHLIDERKVYDSRLYAIYTEFHLRPAFALGCLCFVLVGCPVGIWLSKSDYLSSFIVCFIPIVILYYPLMLCMINMARNGKFPPWMGVYTADGLMLLAGLVLFHRLARN